jgi:murein L,D-transpeptidase YcbB/YkuD
MGFKALGGRSIVALFFALWGVIACPGWTWATATTAETRSGPSSDQSAVFTLWFGENAKPTTALEDRRLLDPAQVAAFYRNRLFQPFWITDETLNRMGARFLEILGDADAHGFSADDYHYSVLFPLAEQLAAQSEENPPTAEQQAGLDAMLTDAFLAFGRDLAYGRGRGRTRTPFSNLETEVDVAAILTALEKHGDVDLAVTALAPPHPEYWGLVEAGRRMKAIVQWGGWPAIPKSVQEKLYAGDNSDSIPPLRQFLRITGDLRDDQPEDETLFDGELEEAVKSFQARHGLLVDGVVAGFTMAELNVSALQRYEQILANLERWRRLPRDFGSRFIRVNIAAFTLEGFDQGRKGLDMRVIVGQGTWQTPELSQGIKEVVINPWWYVPPSIVPEIKSTKGYQVSESEDGTAISQPPGPGNALGRIKIRFPNPHNVYLHDTPGKSLFRRSFRALSHGCIRMQKPIDAALFLLQDDPEWSRKRVMEMIDKGATLNVPVPSPATVYLIYVTAWLGPDGEIQFRRDIYNRDASYLNVLAPITPKTVMAGEPGPAAGPAVFARFVHSGGESFRPTPHP